ncbi:hypothetical protein D2A34_08645 [Clostridium chromiireducens]|uniref:Uncharacterized protein n=1 Tax=Clostridium chromiireducens TaxID=225345 RepID=A0A399IQH7_9CLOT|nr:DUF6710 family protein [Clostridium chromiireducens]RII35265.1 hypothetical protein D2A34_08645 [Clostridium chromiireducens]
MSIDFRKRIHKLARSNSEVPKLEEELRNMNKLEELLELAEIIIAEGGANYVPIKLYINSLGQIVRDRLIMKMYLGEEVDFIESIFNDLGFRLRKYFDRDLLNEEEKMIDISLDNDMAIPIAGDRKRFAKRLAKDTRGNRSSFFYNHNDYKAHLFLPINIAIIYYGNHSLLAGILKKEGKIKSDYVFDMGNKYDEIKFDGTYYREIKTNEIIYRVKNFELGVIFEIGRMLKQYNIHL